MRTFHISKDQEVLILQTQNLLSYSHECVIIQGGDLACGPVPDIENNDNSTSQVSGAIVFGNSGIKTKFCSKGEVNS